MYFIVLFLKNAAGTYKVPAVHINKTRYFQTTAGRY